ncbi:hypothetical protein LINPERPRIM_LOCUS16357 [Linum perenne]
MQECESCHK